MNRELHCTQADLLIQRGLDGRLSSAERAVLDTHLSGCAACRTAWDEYRSLARDTASWTKNTLTADDPGAAFTDRVMDRIAAGAAAPQPIFTRSSLVLSLCALLLLTVLSLWAGPWLPTLAPSRVSPAALTGLLPSGSLSLAGLIETTTHLSQDAQAMWKALTASPLLPARWMWGALAAAGGVNLFFVQETRRRARETAL